MSTDDRRSEPDARILRQMVRELAEDPLPVLPWEKMEARLFADTGEGRADNGKGEADIEPSENRPSLVSDDDDSSPSAIPASLAGRESLTPREPSAARPLHSTPASSTMGRWARRVAAVAAIAAGMGGVFYASGGNPNGSVVAVAEPIDPAQVPQAPGMPAGVLDAKSLGVGDVVEAALGPIAFGSSEAAGTSERNDRVAWTLAAGSRVVVREPASALVHVVELESGSVHVEASGPKRFVVRAGQTEVLSAQTGASFTVTRSSRGLVVHVQTGSVFVGQRGVAGEHGKSGEGRLLDAPVRASVSLDGARTVELIPDEVVTAMQPPAPPPTDRVDPATEVEAAVRVPVRAQGPVEHPAQKAEPAQPAAPTAPPPGPISESSIRATVQRCFADVQAKKSPNEGVSVSVSSTLRVVVRDDGSVQGVTFNPPLHADLQSCAVFLFRENLGPGARNLSIPVAHR